MKILVCGSTSFVAKNIAAKLKSEGHEVWCFNRGLAKSDGYNLYGDIYSLSNCSCMPKKLDVIINYILLKDQNIESNIKYLEQLLELCNKTSTDKLIHLSSISVYKSLSGTISENSKTETIPEKKGSYGSLKVASDLYLINNASPNLNLILLRPGFVLGSGLVDPIIGTGIRFAHNKILALGNSSCKLPVISREIIDEAIIKCIKIKLLNKKEVFLLADNNSPSKKDYLNQCCIKLGCGERVVSFPNVLWVICALLGGAISSAIGKKELGIYNKLMALTKVNTYNSRDTERCLDISCDTNWNAIIEELADKQNVNYDLKSLVIPDEIDTCIEKNITFIGFGRIARTRHIKAIRNLKLAQKVNVYDLAKNDDDKHVKLIDSVNIHDSDLFVVATPGNYHIESIDLINNKTGSILVEKPLCMNEQELSDWRVFAESRHQPIYVGHNYRLKDNVLQLYDHINKFNSGRLIHVDVLFQSPPVSFDSTPWLRKERKAKTLLLDYSIHFLDLACMFNTLDWNCDLVNHFCNELDQTSTIKGQLISDTYNVSFLLRQGYIPRMAKIKYVFQNYIAELSFFPDTFVSFMSHDDSAIYSTMHCRYKAAFMKKVNEKAFGRESDYSHQKLYSLVFSSHEYMDNLTVEKLSPFYKAIFKVGKCVYE